MDKHFTIETAETNSGVKHHLKNKLIVFFSIAELIYFVPQKRRFK